LVDAVLQDASVSEGQGIASHAASAIATARGLAERLGLDASGMNVLHSSNNTIVHLPNCGLVAKVGTSTEAAETLSRALAVAPPDGSVRGDRSAGAAVPPGPHLQGGSLAHALEIFRTGPDPELDDDELAHSIERLHSHLATWSGELPDYRDRIRQRANNATEPPDAAGSKRRQA
jgi:hypothetical protein